MDRPPNRAKLRAAESQDESSNELVTLGSMAHGGDTVARLSSGQVVFVTGGIPGEDVTIARAPEQGGLARGLVETFVTASPNRVVPPCSYFGVCGGCQWQHIDYPAQVAFKQRLLRETVQHQTGLATLPLPDPIEAASPWQYRTAAQFHVTPEGRLGYLRIRSHDALPVDHCQVCHPLIQDSLRLLQDIVPQAMAVTVGASSLREIAVRLASDERGDSLLLVCYGPPSARAVAERIALSFSSRQPLTRGCWFVLTGGNRNVVDDRELLCGRATVRQRVGPLSFRIGPTVFFQVNAQQTTTLVGLVREHVARIQPKKLLDLYCGVGLFTLSVADLAEQVGGADNNEAAIDLARESALENDLPDVRFLAAPSHEALALHSGPDMVLLDPPRAGCGRDVLATLLERKPRHLVYVSCDPPTLARDLKELLGGGYRLTSLQMVDLFPQTYHIESVALLEVV